MEINLKIESYTVLSILILLSGILREYIFYKLFGISILPFLEPSESILLFFDVILFFSIFLVLNLFIILIFHNKIIIPSFEFKFKESIKNNFVRILKGASFLLICLTLVIINSKIDFFSQRELIYWIVLLFIGFYLNPLLLMLISALSHASKSVKQVLIFLLITINICAFASLSGYNEAKKVRNCYYCGSEFFGEGFTFKSDSLNYYIGKTSNFYFFYESRSNEVMIYPNELITTIKMK
jgi:hypothetical protein